MSFAKCPKCDDNLKIVRYMKDGEEKSFIAHESSTKENPTSCDFTIFQNFMGTQLNEEQLKELIETGKLKKKLTIKVPVKFENGKTSIDFEALKRK